MLVLLTNAPYIEENGTENLQDYLAKPVKGKLLEKVNCPNFCGGSTDNV